MLGDTTISHSVLRFKSETIPRRDDPRLSHIVKRLESCKPQGMYRSSENEFLLCYDGESQSLWDNCLLMSFQNLVSTSIDMERVVGLRMKWWSSGKARQNALLSTRLTFYFLILDSLKSDISKPVGWLKLYLAVKLDAPGTDVEHRPYHQFILRAQTVGKRALTKNQECMV